MSKILAFTALFVVIFSSFVSGQKNKSIYNTKINRPQRVYIKQYNGNIYIYQLDSVIIAKAIQKKSNATDKSNTSKYPKIFIVDPLPIALFDTTADGQYKGYRFIKFNCLTTTLGSSLPDFRFPPTVMISPGNNNSLKLGEITEKGFYILSNESETFTALISEKFKKPNIPPKANAGVDQIIYLKE